MPGLTAADTIRILVATDSHVGYNERDPIRGDDSWKSFHEVMCLAKERDVDMVLLAGDLFHENKPSRKSMYQVMRSIRMNCLGDKPCELEMLSDASENFQGAFNHVNYEDPDINVAIPVFSIHGNHDDPSGEGHLAALDLLQISGLVNYYGRTPESDNILIKPVLLQKGHTKLALYGMSNVRDERLFRTFRDGKVKFFQPNTQKSDWFNLMSVHQNHHAYTETGYLPENFLPEFLDLVVWGHEHECLIEPRYNPEMSFHVMQPGSSVATSLMPGEAVPKHVAIVSVTGKEFKCEPIRLKTVRPFVMREIALQDDSRMRAIAKKDENRPEITRYLVGIVEGLIEQAEKDWREAQVGEDVDEEAQPPKPLIRLRVEYTAPEGGKFDCENPQRFSNRFVGKVANLNDVVQFYRKKSSATRKTKDEPEMPEESILAQITIDTVKVEKLVREFLTAQSLTILPQNSFGDAVAQFVDKDDKHAMEMFVEESLKNQFEHLKTSDDVDEDDIAEAMEQYRVKLEELFAQGHLKRPKKGGKTKPRPDNWDSDLDGNWSDQPGARIHSDNDAMDVDEDADLGSIPPKPARGRGKAAGTTRKTAAATKRAAPARTTGRGKKKLVVEEEDEDEEEEEEPILIDDDEDDEEEEESQGLFVSQAKKAPAKTTTRRAASPKKKAQARSTTTRATRAPAGQQTTLNFSQSQPATQTRQTNGTRGRRAQEPSDDEISDDDDAFEPPPPTARTNRTRR
ncbi:meiotic recombination [Taxawa tesnikishii (nom. ined.)]|nr:meiotic recombination [Dothideales sp. JES 119]